MMKLKTLACSPALTGYGTCAIGETFVLEEVVVVAQEKYSDKYKTTDYGFVDLLEKHSISQRVKFLQQR